VVTIYVEGGGDGASLKSECRHAFTELLKKAGFERRMPKIRPMGSRPATFDAFKIAHAKGNAGAFVMLLIDSEETPKDIDAWKHLKSRDGWARPEKASDDQAQLMVVCMETWLIADSKAFAEYFGKHVKEDKLPATNIEKRSMSDVITAMASATVTSKPKGKYGKSRDSFKLLSQIDPAKLTDRCEWAARFFEALQKYC
jgi:hypothetical protein